MNARPTGERYFAPTAPLDRLGDRPTTPSPTPVRPLLVSFPKRDEAMNRVFDYYHAKYCCYGATRLKYHLDEVYEYFRELLALLELANGKKRHSSGRRFPRVLEFACEKLAEMEVINEMIKNRMRIGR